ncbi:MAG: 4Fe-4S dicluster domain-containing protein [Candidatus Omnitrophica bacterium]|nr:4Fe-4S dicluster domain-containing protein [Candidatus Omnitrophota bacterium]
MMTSQKILKKAKFSDFIKLLSDDYEVYVPVKKGNHRYLKKYAGNVDEIVIGEVRPVEPLKAFFSRAREVVAHGFKNDVPRPDNKPYAIIGVKACDLKGFKIQDFVFANSDEQDPFYARNRAENLIVSADCTCAIDTCFCLALGIQPFPEENFDINLSQIEDGFVVQAGSDKGRALVEKNPSLFENASDGQVRARDQQRSRVRGLVETNIKEHEVPHQDRFKDIIKNSESALWEEESRTCVECGACNTICPTCHCFLLYDQKVGESTQRFRIWDSCMIKDFARVAGGGNPRPKLWMRLRNRFEKKFDYFPRVSGVYACTGCGRCISACPAEIDIRKVLKKLVDNK